MDLRFKLKEIPQNGAPQRHTRAVPAPLLAAVLDGPGGNGADPKQATCELEVDLFRDHEEVIVRGRLRGSLVLPCSRCVEPARFVIDTPVDAMFVRQGTPEPDLEDLPEEDVEALLATPDRFEHDGKAMDLEELVRETLIAELPISPRCMRGCLGLCPQCGANRNTPEGQACGHTGEAVDLPSPSTRLAGLANVKLSS